MEHPDSSLPPVPPAPPHGHSGAPSGSAEIPLIRFKEIESTSKLARRLAETGQLRGRPAMIVAETQSGGVGRFKRQWTSPIGGLWCTLAWPLPTGAAGDQVIDGLGLRVGVALTGVVRRVLHQQTKRPAVVRLKWPNDVMINGRKVAGVLCEVVSIPGAAGAGRCVLVGVGINANLSVALFPPEMREKVTGMLDHVARQIDLDTLRAAVQTALIEALLAHGMPPETLRAARDMLFGVGAPAVVTLPLGERIHGSLLGIDQRGMAQLRTDDGVFTAPAGAMLMFDEHAGSHA